MKLFLVSECLVPIVENGVKIGTRIDDANYFVKNLQNEIKNFDSFVFVCNEPLSFERNDASAKKISEALKNQLKPFKNTIVLDERTKSNAKEILNTADLIFIQGGKIPAQNKFLHDINFDIVKDKDVVIIGKSAGAMNMAKNVYNYPEEDADISEDRWIKGLGLSDYIIIPHFNTKNGNEFCLGNFNLLTDYYMPTSKNNTLCALTNGSYILLKDNIATVYGEVYIIKNERVIKICKNNEIKNLKEII